MKKWYRSRRDKKLFGICGGMAEMLNVDATLLRLVVAVTTVFTGGTVILIYIAAAFIIPKEPNIGMGPGPFGHMPPHFGPESAGYGYTSGGASAGRTSHYGNTGAQHHPLDDMMKDIEQKAMWKEIEQLRAKLAKYEKGE